LHIGHHKARVVALGPVLEPGDHAPLAIPAVGGIAKFPDLALLHPAGGILFGQGQLGHRYDGLQACIARHAEHVAHAMALAPAHQALAAEARIAAHDDRHIGPRLAQPRDEQLDERRGVLGSIDAAAAQIAGEQRIAAEHVQRKVAVMIVVAVELAQLLVAMQRDV
jgi:hypothetical protein